jgi:hypothetical protein
MRYILFVFTIVLLLASRSVFATEYQVVGGCTGIVLEGGWHDFLPEYPYEPCPLNYWVIARRYNEDLTPKSYQCGTMSQACNFKVEIPEGKK